MTLADPSLIGPGGLIFCEYANAAMGERHELRLHVAAFNHTPVGAAHDFLYTGTGLVAPAESGIIATFQGFGALWAPYYSSDWVLTLRSVFYNDAGAMTQLALVPFALPIAGTGPPADASGVVLRRSFILRSTEGMRRRLYLVQLSSPVVDQTVDVSASAGGFDARDRALLSYLGGSATGCVAPDGRRFRAQGRVRSWWARRLAPAPAGDPSAAGRDTFIGPTAPPSPEDGWLWVDTSSGTSPFPLWVWSASLSPTVGGEDWGFESPVEGPGNYEYNPTGTAWTFDGAGVSGNGSPFTEGNDNAPQGAQVAFLQFNGRIERPFTTTTATDYRVSFLGSKRAPGGTGGPQTVHVLVDGVERGVFVVESYPGYQSYATAAFSLGAGTHTLRFQGDSGGVDVTAFLDGVEVATAAVGAWEPVGLISTSGGGGGGGGGGAFDGTLTGACLVFPLGATICNDAAHVLHFTTPGGTHAMDDTGITLPGGHRLEVVP